MLYYIGQALEAVNQAAESVQKIRALDKKRIESNEYPSLFGSAIGQAICVEGDINMLRAVLLMAKREAALLDRLLKVAHALDLSIKDEPDSDLAWMEKLVSGEYRSEASDLSEKIAEAISEIREGEYEAEAEKAVESMKASGFEFVENNDFEGYRRGD